MSNNKTAATWHPYTSAQEALAAIQVERAEREADAHRRQVDGLMRAIAKRAGLA